MSPVRFNHAGKVVLQLAIVGPMNILAPFAFVLGPFTLYGLLFEGLRNVSDIVIGLGWLGLVGLYLTILIPRQKIVLRPRLRFTANGLLILGLLLTALVFAENGNESSRTLPSPSLIDLAQIWLFCGPACVALFNLYRLHNLESLIGNES